MRFTLLLVAAEVATASSWFGKTVYNKWHQTELERWLSDNNVPYPTPADRKDLESLVKQNWDSHVVTPYNSWDADQLQKYISLKGEQIKKGTEKNKDSLVSQVKASWTDTENTANDAYASSRDWIFDTWTESQLKAFCDRHGIPVPQPRNRDSLLKVARENYQTAANKISETAAYPGNWLWENWSDSELKAWCDERGVPVPQNGKRDQYIAAVRRNSRVASNNLAAWSSSLASSAAAATQSISDALFDTYSDSQLKKWADEKGIKVPQGSKRNELLALCRRQNAQLNSEAARASSSAASAYGQASSSVVSAYGAATSSAGNEYAQASHTAALNFDYATSVAWSYLEWAKAQVGLAASTASASATSLSGKAAASASSASARAASSSSSASKSAASASSSLSKSGSSAASSASKSASSKYSSASKAAKQEL